MNEADLLNARLCTALMRLGTRMATSFDQHFAPSGVTQAQFRLLLAVWEQGGESGIAPSELADHLLIERATVSVLAQGLVQRSLLDRLPGQNRRTHRLALTPAGGELLAQLIPQAVHFADHTLAGLHSTRLGLLRDTLDEIEAKLRHLAAAQERP
jgi:DNA-binding MarR family transcriptional regulator